ncbi:MAG TPA: hypothetical protein VIV66_22190, partial [Pyrinomonadaceae bacterium]
ELVNTPEFSQAQRQRKKVEALFAELKNQIGLRRLRLRRMKFVRERSSWQRLRRISSDWCGFSLAQQHLLWPPLEMTIELVASRLTGRMITPITEFFNTHTWLRQSLTPVANCF